MGKMSNILVVFSQSGVCERVGEGAAVLGTKASLCAEHGRVQSSPTGWRVFLQQILNTCAGSLQKKTIKRLCRLNLLIDKGTVSTLNQNHL